MTFNDPYARHSGYIAPAFARSEIWRVALVALGFEFTFMLTPDILVALAPSQSAVEAIRKSVTPITTLYQFLAFALSGAVLLMLVRVIHLRGLASLLGPWGDLKDHLIRVAIAVAIVLAVQEPLLLWQDRSLIAEMREIGRWALWLIPALVALLVQVGTEELFFRGYLQQQLAARSQSRWVWMVLPSAIFGLAHLANGAEVVEGTLWAIWATLLGLACADLTARTGNLGAAIGLHLSNNAFALLVVAVQGQPASGLALFLYPHQDPVLFDRGLAELLQPWALLHITLTALSVFVMWMAARLTLRR